MMIRTRELIAWGLDVYEFRPAEIVQATRAYARNDFYGQPALCVGSPICEDETSLLQAEFSRQSLRADLLAEMLGLEWSLAVVDLRKLLAFQRRLSFPADAAPTEAVANDWPSLISLAFPSPRPVRYKSIHDAESNILQLHSDDPTLHLRTTADLTTPLAVHSGGPFFEVAQYRGRWFLRDGYHRAYTLLNAGIERVPAVIVYARGLSELGADRPWFFPESVLFSSRPPRVTDFLNEDLTTEYHRPGTHTTIRIPFEESLAIPPSGERT